MDTLGVRPAYTPAYISHMQYMEARHPLLSIFDSFLLTETWLAGLEYGIRIGKSQTQGDSVPSENNTSATGKDASL
jgi:hypothetical protein